MSGVNVMLRALTGALLAIGCCFLISTPSEAEKEKPASSNKDKGFVSIFDGKTLKGWRISARSGHSGKSKHKSGGRWVVDEKEKCILGSQDIPGNGGILITEKEHKNFEVVLDMRNDFGPDSGLFLRSNDKGQAHQAMIDYHKGGNLMGVYGEGLSPGYHVQNFTFPGDKPSVIKEQKAAFALPVKADKWADFWKHGEWNELRARIEGNPAKMTTWIKGVKFMEYTDKVKRMDKGGIALQVHGGGDYTKQYVRYRNIRVKELD
jgi:hypothetical protein